MSYFISRRAMLSFAALSAVTLTAVGCSSGSTAPALGEQSSAVTAAAASMVDPVSALLALAAATSDGGASLTSAEADAYAAQVPRFAADAASAAGVSTVATALRHHVAGLRISGQTVTGLDLSSCSGAATATFDPQNGNYAGVGVTYSGDGWTTVHSAALTVGSDGIWRGALPGVDANANLTFAVQLGQPGGDSSWLNDPRENRPGAGGHVDYRQALAICEPVATPATPPFVRLVQSFARPDSLDGSAVSLDEFSWMVAQTTWEGGPGIDDPTTLDPVVAALDAMAAAGVDFEGGIYPNMRAFLASMRMRLTSTTAVTLQRNGVNQYVFVTAPDGAQWMRVYYSTDGWSTPKVVECTPLGRAGIVSCGLGFIPAGALVSYSAIVRYASGPDEYVHASDGGNVFQKIP
jgi:hypothetical protein